MVKKGIFVQKGVVMKRIQKLLFIAIAFIVSCNVHAQEPQFAESEELVMSQPSQSSFVPHQPLMEEDFTVMEVMDDKTDSKKAKTTIDDLKNILTKAESKFNQVKNVVDSDELKGMVAVIHQIKESLKKMVFKNGPGFQITNKTENPIWVSLVVGDAIQTNQDEYGRDQIAPGEKLTMEIDTNKDLMIGIYTSDPEVALYSPETRTLMPRPDYMFATTEGARGKTKYFSWNPAKHNVPAKYLYPQTGRLAGTVGVSRSNYSLSNNLKSFHLMLKESK